jgi:glutathione synthase/RimK-type ligase-like ATP-grasp enzyme
LEQPAGRVRTRDLAFAPSPDDVPIYILAPASISSGSLTQHVAEVASQGARIRVLQDAADIPSTEPPPLIVNWGCTHALPEGIIALNQPASVRTASDQVESIRRLGELAPRTVANPEDVGLLGSDPIVAKRRHGTRGSGKAVLTLSGLPSERAGYDLFQEFIPDRREYRVSVLSGHIASAYVKRPPDSVPPDDLHPAWTFERAQVLPKAVAVVAKEAARRIGLDYAGVDVIEDRHTGRVYCLEANSAPGMSQDTLKQVYAQIQQVLRRRLARVS